MLLKDQVALVTGGSRGIGKAIVQALSREGAKVVFVYKGSQEAATALATETGAEAVQGDVSQKADAERIVEKVIADHGKLDILVNNAGVIKDGLFLRMSEEDWNTVIGTNLGGTFHFCRAVAAQMALKQRSGRIINISSVAGTHVNAGQANYSASKGGVNAFTKVLAVELGGRGVTVNAIAPGFIETDMSEAVRNKAGDVIAKKMIPLKRLGKPEDIAHVAVFLASAAAGYVTGQVITVDGGLSLGAVAFFWFADFRETDMTKDEIFGKVKATLVDSLNVDDDEVTMDSTLQGDLGAESIDFLDIVFRLEREFNIKIPRGELFPESIFQGDPDLVKDGKVTAKGLATLEESMPFANQAALAKFKADPTLESIGSLFTVEAIVNYIEMKTKA